MILLVGFFLLVACQSSWKPLDPKNDGKQTSSIPPKNIPRVPRKTPLSKRKLKQNTKKNLQQNSQPNTKKNLQQSNQQTSQKPLNTAKLLTKINPGPVKAMLDDMGLNKGELKHALVKLAIDVQNNPSHTGHKVLDFLTKRRSYFHKEKTENDLFIWLLTGVTSNDNLADGDLPEVVDFFIKNSGNAIDFKNLKTKEGSILDNLLGKLLFPSYFNNENAKVNIKKLGLVLVKKGASISENEKEKLLIWVSVSPYEEVQKDLLEFLDTFEQCGIKTINKRGSERLIRTIVELGSTGDTEDILLFLINHAKNFDPNMLVKDSEGTETTLIANSVSNLRLKIFENLIKKVARIEGLIPPKNHTLLTMALYDAPYLKENKKFVELLLDHKDFAKIMNVQGGSSPNYTPTFLVIDACFRCLSTQRSEGFYPSEDYRFWRGILTKLLDKGGRLAPGEKAKLNSLKTLLNRSQKNIIEKEVMHDSHL